MSSTSPDQDAQPRDESRGPSALNSITEEKLHSNVTAVILPRTHRPPRESLYLAPFMTNSLLLRVHNIINGYSREQRDGLIKHAALGYVCAALTGSPVPVDHDTAAHMGNAMDEAMKRYSARRKRLEKHRARPSNAAALKADAEQLYICQFGGTPQRPDPAVVHGTHV